MSRTDRIIFSTLIGIGISAGVFGIRTNYQKSQLVIHTPGGKATMHFNQLRSVNLTDPLTERVVKLESLPPNAHRLVLLLSPADCSSCLRVLPMLYDLPRHLPRGQLHVDAIIVRSTREEAATYIAELKNIGDLTFYLDSFNDVERSVGLPDRTPVAALLDSRFRIQLAHAATTDAGDQQQFVNAVVQLTEKEK